jgi:RimJ/RimL family protein N-acetyltransferase
VSRRSSRWPRVNFSLIRLIHFAYNPWQKKQSWRFGVRLKPEISGESSADANQPSLIGMVALFDIQNQYKAEIGYWLGAAYHGQGIMTEAVRAVVSYAFGTMGMGRLYAYTSVENTQSLAMLQKVGFVMEGVMRQHTMRDGRWDDTVIMGIIRDDFRTNEK